MKINKEDLRDKILQSFKSQGFAINPHLRPKKDEKDVLRNVHEQKRKEKIRLHKKFLMKNINKIKKYMISGEELNPEKIDLKLIEVKPKSLCSDIFFWWNLIWWSIPYGRPIGRQMRFILWDSYHNSPFGLIGLQSPPLRSAVRDGFIGLNNGNVDYWINQSLYAQRIGALPPYNDLLGGKMVALSLTSNEIRNLYTKKYENKETILKKRNLPNRLLFITTTSAYGKSSVYERINYKGEKVSRFIGFTSGSGTFQLREELYQECIRYLEQEGRDTKRGYGTGPSRKLHLVNTAFRLLNIPSFIYHNINRGFYIFPNVKNLREVVQSEKIPQWYDRNFTELSDYWLERWALPRSERIDKWRAFNPDEFIKNAETLITSA